LGHLVSSSEHPLSLDLATPPARRLWSFRAQRHVDRLQYLFLSKRFEQVIHSSRVKSLRAQSFV